MKPKEVKNIEDFKIFLKDVVSNVNYSNSVLIDELYNMFKTYNTNNIRQIYDNFSAYFKSKRGGVTSSIMSVKYWEALGWNNLDEIKNKISLEQKRRSPRCIEYYLTRGYTKEDGEKEITKIQKEVTKKRYTKYTKQEISEQSVWSFGYWIKLGYTEDEARQKIRNYNGACRECYNTDDEFKKYKNNISKMKKDLYYSNPENYWGKHTPYTSKEENEFFNDITTFIYDIKHLTFGINVANTKFSNDYKRVYVLCDGYLKCDNKIIIIEYDGLYWHDENFDNDRDNTILDLRKDVIGIIRVSDEYYKNNKLQTLIERLTYGIEKIKSGECKKELIY